MWTEHNDNGRTGQNLNETVLTPADVTPSTFGALFHYTLDDQSYSQPLYVPGLTMSVDNAVHNVVFVTTVNDSVYAFDADSGTANGGNPLWHVNLAPSGATVPANTNMSALGACGGAYQDFAGKFGIVGTPVIDTSTNTLYVVARTIENGAWIQRLHALDCTSGAEKFGGPVVISGSYGGTTFDPTLNNQRTALALANGVVYIGWSSHCDFGNYHGYLMGYNASNLNQVAVWSATTSGTEAGIWQSGQAPSIDGNNNLYIITGNGTLDGSANFGESFVKLAGGSLTEQDYFAPNTFNNLNQNDLDLGAAGCLLIPGTTDVVGGGKQGILYLLNQNNLGHENATDQAVQEFQATFPQGGNPGEVHGGPVWFNNGTASYMYLWGDNDFCRAFQWNGSSFNTTPAGTSTMLAPVTGSGDPGGFLSISANGTSNGILWAVTPYNGDANQSTVPGILHAFNATPSGGTLTELWNSQMNASRDSFGNFGKFSYPTIANGKVYLSTFGTAGSGSGGLWVYGNVTAPVEGPYGGTPAAIPGTVQAENYDTGGQSVAYNVTSINGSANNYRTDGVELEASTDTGAGYDVGWSAAGQWFKYTVDVATAGTYTVTFRVANGNTTNGTFHLQNAAGTNLSGTVTVAPTGGWQNWTSVTANVTLPAGQQVLTWMQDAGGFNLNYMTFAAQSSGEGPYGGTPAAIPGTVQAENYDTGGQGVAFNATAGNGTGNTYRPDGIDLEATTDTGGGYDLGWTGAGQWFKYTVNVSTAGTYAVTFRVAAPAAVTDGFHIADSTGTNLSGNVNVPATGGWQTWTNVTANVTLPAGQQVLTMAEDNGGWNINYTTFESSSGTVPGPPTLSGSATSGQVSLSWTTSTGATAYNVFRGTTSGGETSLSTGLTGTSYSDTAVTNGTTYYYEVKAVNASGSSNNSNEVAETPPSSGEGAYGGTPAAIPGTVQAENYDTGGQGVAYNVSSINGSGNGYRTDGVDLEATTDTGAGYDLGWTAAGQWFKYTVNVSTAGTYAVSFRLAAPNAVADAFHLANSAGANLSGNINAPATGGWQNWTTVTANVTLPAGTQILTLDQDNPGWNINYATFANSGGTLTPVDQIDAGSASAVSPFVADADFSAGNEFSSTNAINLNGQSNAAPAAVYQTVRWNSSFNYTIPNLTAGATYTVRLHFCELSWTANGQRVFNVAVNGTNWLSNFDIFATAGGQNNALVEQTTTTANSSGQIVISFTQGTADNPEVAGVEILH